MTACFGAVEKKIMTRSALLFASYAVTQLVPYDSDYIFITEQHKNHFVRKKKYYQASLHGVVTASFFASLLFCFTWKMLCYQMKISCNQLLFFIWLSIAYCKEKKFDNIRIES